MDRFLGAFVNIPHSAFLIPEDRGERGKRRKPLRKSVSLQSGLRSYQVSRGTSAKGRMGEPEPFLIFSGMATK